MRGVIAQSVAVPRQTRISAPPRVSPAIGDKRVSDERPDARFSEQMPTGAWLLRVVGATMGAGGVAALVLSPQSRSSEQIRGGSRVDPYRTFSTLPKRTTLPAALAAFLPGPGQGSRSERNLAASRPGGSGIEGRVGRGAGCCGRARRSCRASVRGLVHRRARLAGRGAGLRVGETAELHARGDRRVDLASVLGDRSARAEIEHCPAAAMVSAEVGESVAAHGSQPLPRSGSWLGGLGAVAARSCCLARPGGRDFGAHRALPV